MVGALSVPLAAEVGVRLGATALPEPVQWYDARTQVKVEQMDRSSRRGQEMDFVFAGTSQVFRGVNPSVFDSSGSRRTSSYNAGLLGGMPPLQERWLLEEVGPRLKPEVVVYGLSSLDFQGRRYKRPERAYNSAPATRKGLMAELDRFWARHLRLVRHRAQIRDPRRYAELMKAVVEREDGQVEKHRKSITARGYQVKHRNEFNRAEAERLRTKVLADYRISRRGSGSISRLVRRLERRGVDVVFVHMPVPDGFIPLHPRGFRDYRDAKRHLAALADRLDVDLIDMSRSMPESLFIDYTHLNEKGARRFSKKLKRELSALGY